MVFGAASVAIGTIYLVRELGISPGLLGVVFAAASIGVLAGSTITSRYSARIGVGRLMTGGLALAGVGAISIPIVGGPLYVIVVVVILVEIAIEAGIVMFQIQLVSLKQAVEPDHLRGRMTSIFVVSSRAAIPVGGLLGGFLGESIGVRNTLFVGAVGEGLSAIWLVYFGVWRIHDLPGTPAE